MKFKISMGLGLITKRQGWKFMLETAKQIGLDGVDYGLTDEDYRKPESIYSKSDDEIIAYYTEVYETAQKMGIEISQTHGRLVICHDDPEETEAAIRNARLDCLASRCLHSPYVVFHGVTKYFNGLEPTPETIHYLNDSLFSRILKFAREYDVKVATETFGDDENKRYFFANLMEFEKTFNQICSHDNNGDNFVVCLDSGHTNDAAGIYDNPSVGDTIRKLGNKIACLHLHDNEGCTDQHRMPFSGNVDWLDVFNALEEIGYNGWFNLELKLNQLKVFGKGFEIEYAAFAVKMLRFMLHQRFGTGCCNYSESDKSWLSYSKLCDRIN